MSVLKPPDLSGVSMPVAQNEPVPGTLTMPLAEPAWAGARWVVNRPFRKSMMTLPFECASAGSVVVIQKVGSRGDDHDRPSQCIAMVFWWSESTVAFDTPRAQMSSGATPSTVTGVPTGTETFCQVRPFQCRTTAGP